MINEENKTISIVWSVDDVLMQAENDEVQLNENEAWDILKSLCRFHCCNYGINWDTISTAINDFVENRDMEIEA